MRAVLLTRHSEFQIFCANQLWRSGLIAGAIVEGGVSFVRTSGPWSRFGVVRKNAGLLLGATLRRPIVLADYARLFRNKERYFGSQALHNRRLLGSGFTAFEDDLPVVSVADINSATAQEALRELAPDVVLVFGTRLIKGEIFLSSPVPFINLHWGWSPDYRGDGIVPALAREGVGGLGVTVHRLSTRIDGGDILARARPSVDGQDNFYSIGLKLTLLGIGLLTKVLERYQRGEPLVGTPQDLSRGALFDSRYMKRHPRLYHDAWRNLHGAVQ